MPARKVFSVEDRLCAERFDDDVSKIDKPRVFLQTDPTACQQVFGFVFEVEHGFAIEARGEVVAFDFDHRRSPLFFAERFRNRFGAADQAAGSELVT